MKAACEQVQLGGSMSLRYRQSAPRARAALWAAPAEVGAEHPPGSGCRVVAVREGTLAPLCCWRGDGSGPTELSLTHAQEGRLQ